MARGKLLSSLSCFGLQLSLFPVLDPKPLLFRALVASFKVPLATSSSFLKYKYRHFPIFSRRGHPQDRISQLLLSRHNFP